MELQLSEPIAACILEFTAYKDLAALLNCSRGMRFPGRSVDVQNCYVNCIEGRYFETRQLFGTARRNLSRANLRVDALEPIANRYTLARVVCVDCDLVLPLSTATEIESSGRYTCGECAYERVVTVVTTDWHTERGLTFAPPHRLRCARCDEDSVVIGSQRLCPECIDSYDVVVSTFACTACGVGREMGMELFTRLDREGLYCQQCVGNQARERCTVDRGIGIMEVVRANVISDIEVQLGPDVVREVLAAEGSESEEGSESQEGSDSEEASESESADVLACSICNSDDGNVNRYTLVDGCIVCAPCHDADDSLPAVESSF